ncbi:MAG: NlpC/P60 family protein [bacterium]
MPALFSIIILITACTPSIRYSRPDRQTRSDKKAIMDDYKPVQSSSMPRSKMDMIIQNYLGIPYSWGGTSCNGMDCSGLTLSVFKEAFDITLPHNSQKQFQMGKKVSQSNLSYGDLVFFRIHSFRISHVGIFIGNNEFVHASLKRGVIRSNLSDKYYKHRYAGAKRILEPGQLY